MQPLLRARYPSRTTPLWRRGFRTFTSIIEARNVHFLHVAQPCLPASGRVFSPRCVNGGSRHDLRDYDEMNEAYRGRVGDNPPVRTTVGCYGGIPGGSLVEIDCIAVV